LFLLFVSSFLLLSLFLFGYLLCEESSWQDSNIAIAPDKIEGNYFCSKSPCPLVLLLTTNNRHGTILHFRGRAGGELFSRRYGRDRDPLMGALIKKKPCHSLDGKKGGLFHDPLQGGLTKKKPCHS
jgi:hypothetical protein